MRKQILLILMVFLWGISITSCEGWRKSKYLVVSDVIHFEIQGDGKALNFPIFVETINMEKIVRDVNLAEYYYNKLSSIYDFKSFTFITRRHSEHMLERAGALHQPQTIYTFEDSLSKVSLSFISFEKGQARYAFRIIDKRTGQVRDHYVEVPSGQSASIGTLFDQKKNKGHLIIVSMISQEITDKLTPEEFADFLKRKNAMDSSVDSAGFKPGDQQWMDELFGQGTLKLPIERASYEKSDSAEEIIDFDSPPKPIGGLSVEYPKSAKHGGIEGTVLLSVRIESDGSVSNVTIVKGVREDLNQAAVQAIKQSRWTPAIKDNKPIGIKVTIPIQFKLQD